MSQRAFRYFGDRVEFFPFGLLWPGFSIADESTYRFLKARRELIAKAEWPLIALVWLSTLLFDRSVSASLAGVALVAGLVLRYFLLVSVARKLGLRPAKSTAVARICEIWLITPRDLRAVGMIGSGCLWIGGILWLAADHWHLRKGSLAALVAAAIVSLLALLVWIQVSRHSQSGTPN